MKRSLYAIVAFCLLLGLVNQAQAVVKFTVYAYWYNWQILQEVPIEDVDLELWYQEEEDGDWFIEDFEHVGNGHYDAPELADLPYSWKVKIVDLPYTGVSPWVGIWATPGITVTHIDWQMTFPM